MKRIQATARMNPDNITLSEKKQTQKTTLPYDPIYVIYPEEINPL